MTDASWLLVWLLVLGAGLGGCVFLHRVGLETTYARDLLHVGTGIWVLGWPYWKGAAGPIALVGMAVVLTALVPVVAKKSALVAGVEASFSGGDERWNGLVLYTLAYAVMTAIGLFFDAFAAAVGLLVLALGDGIGGAIGRRFGRLRFTAPGGKTKTLEGTLAVLLASALAVAIAAWRFDRPVATLAVATIAFGVATAEALSPRGMDNAVVPAVGWMLAELVT